MKHDQITYLKNEQITYLKNEQITHYTGIPHLTLTLLNISFNLSLFTGSSTGNILYSVSQYPLPSQLTR